MPQFDTDLLAELITRRRECLQKLRTMVGKQLELAADGSVTALLDVLSSKQRVIAALQDVDRELSPFRDQDPDARQWRDDETRRKCAQELSECQMLMDRIMADEKQSELEMIRRRDEIAGRLHGAHQAGLARGAYTAQSRSGPRHIDLASDAR